MGNYNIFLINEGEKSGKPVFAVFVNFLDQKFGYETERGTTFK